MTYEKVLQGMLEDYSSMCGFVPADGSDLMIRLRTVAAAIWGIHRRVDALEKKCNIYTAEGEALDSFAALAGITRRAAVPAEGRVCFLAPSRLSAPVVIPKGTELLSGSYPDAVAVTLEDTVITTDSSEANVTARLVNETGMGLPSGAFTVIRQHIYPGLKVLSFEFSNGSAVESDDQLRERILRSLIAPANGVNLEYYKRVVNELPCVKDSVVKTDGIGDIRVIFAPSGTLTDGDTAEKINEELQKKCIFGHRVTVERAESEEVSLTVYAELSEKGRTVKNIEQYAKDLLTELLRGKKLGGRLTAAQVYALYDACGCFTDFTVSGDFPVVAAETRELSAGYVSVSVV